MKAYSCAIKKIKNNFIEKSALLIVGQRSKIVSGLTFININIS